MLHSRNLEYQHPTSPLVIGLNMFENNLVYVPLSKQVRCAQDARFTSMLEKLRQTSIRYPVTREILEELRLLQLTP